jgi:DNA invertase Pin-like site-specific DNA recombinase
MAAGRFVAYYRVSTAGQGRSGLGLDAQRKAVADYLNGGAWELVGEFTEVESGKRDDRPELEKAMRACRVHGAALCIAKLDRLTRDAHFLLGLQKAGVEFVAADMPDANRMTVGIMAIIAQHEREQISARTKAALAAAMARGVKLGKPENLSNREQGSRKGNAAKAAMAGRRAADLAHVVREMQAAGAVTLLGLAAGLNARRIPAPRGGSWSATQVKRLLARMGDAG